MPFVPEVAAIRAAMVGPYMIVGIACGLVLAALAAYLRTDGYGSAFWDVGFLALTTVIAALIALPSLRAISYRHSLLHEARTGRYRIAVDGSNLMLEIGNATYVYDFGNFVRAGGDREILGHGTKMSGLTLVARQHEEPRYRLRNALLRPLQKGRVEPVERGGYVVIPLMYYSDDDHDTIIHHVRGHVGSGSSRNPVTK